MKAQAPLLFLLALGSLDLCAGGSVPNWGGCQTSEECDTKLIKGKPMCCHAGDRRCLTMDDCDWVNWIEKAKEPRNCDCIPPHQHGSYNKHWESCGMSQDCDPTTRSDGRRLWCMEGDRRCMTKEDCQWANLIDHTTRDCSYRRDAFYNHCYNGLHDVIFEGDVDCGGLCPKNPN
eukprot:m51a1_g14431 hypothetical protein (175) ;mRNA; r:528131-528763